MNSKKSSELSDPPLSHDLLKGRVILVTGAGQGLGRAAAMAFAAHGATVILLGRTVAKLEKVYDEIVAAGGPQPAIFPMDLGLAVDCDFDTLAHSILLQMRRLDGILHCAAAFEGLSPLSQQNVEQWEKQFKVNAAAPFAINRACAPLLRKSSDGAVVLVGETHGHRPAAYWGGFAVSKAALEAYFRVQADEWSAPPDPRTHLVIPGPFDSPQRARTHPGEVKASLPRPEEIARTVLHLMGPEGREQRGRIVEINSLQSTHQPSSPPDRGPG